MMERTIFKNKAKKLEDVPVYYYVGGNPNGECIVFLHAAFADATSFDSQQNYFSKDYRIITLDLLGHGQSQHGSKNAGIDKTSVYLEKILDAEKCEKAHVAGVSIGAVLAQDFANKHPERVRSLCCVGAYDINHYDKSIQSTQGKAQLMFMLRALVSIKWFSKANCKISAVTSEAREAFYRMNLRFKKRSFRYLAGLSNLINKQQTLKRSYPLMILYGEYDNPIVHTAAMTWHENEPSSSLAVIKDAGHLVNMDRPQEFNELYQAFIKSAH